MAQCWPNIPTSQDMLYGFFIKCCIMTGDNNLTKVTFVKFPTKFVFLTLLVISAWLWLKAFIKNLLKGFLSNLLEDKKCIKSLKRSFPQKNPLLNQLDYFTILLGYLAQFSLKTIQAFISGLVPRMFSNFAS